VTKDSFMARDSFSSSSSMRSSSEVAPRVGLGGDVVYDGAQRQEAATSVGILHAGEKHSARPWRRRYTSPLRKLVGAAKEQSAQARAQQQQLLRREKKALTTELLTEFLNNTSLRSGMDGQWLDTSPAEEQILRGQPAFLPLSASLHGEGIGMPPSDTAQDMVSRTLIVSQQLLTDPVTCDSAAAPSGGPSSAESVTQAPSGVLRVEERQGAEGGEEEGASLATAAVSPAQALARAVVSDVLQQAVEDAAQVVENAAQVVEDAAQVIP
jgi:hypothetical protein